MRGPNKGREDMDYSLLLVSPARNEGTPWNHSCALAKGQ